ncbi:type VII secretion protein EccB [Goekera deserti]|uniref:Type VII secretion protein EccB n=1 Tax=Goekera deserti TaxID=2497753 RepID=A0A7K3WE93_9ACTN|nr:type VII secretion protein EccB [Goekera deserti]NDI46660.1 type VII secretion protein EccB [Goekera deserti]NEL54229.1 type VII secretion protein EccB [Goekera deserti]
MPTPREQVDSYAHEVRRQAMALLQGEEPGPVDPRRRLNRALVGGVVVGVLALAVSGVVGLLTGNGETSLPDSGTVLVSGTGDRYVVVDGVLHPALNLASAKLLGGAGVTTVSPSALSGVDRGLPVGIPGAPDALPAAEDLHTAAWDVCSVAPRARDARAEVQVAVGGRLPAAAVLPADQAVVLTVRGDPAARSFLVAGGQRYEATPQARALLGLDRVVPTEVEPQVLDLLPAGPPLAVPAVPGAGGLPTVPLPFTATVGDLVSTATTSRPGTSYVVLGTGLAPVDPFAAVLLAGQAARTVPVTPDVLSGLPADLRPPVPVGWPRRLLGLTAVAPGAPLCLGHDPGRAPVDGAAWAVTVRTPADADVPSGLSPVRPSAGTLPTVATTVVVRSGSGTLVRATTTSGGDGSYRLVLDGGLQFPVADADAVSRLGYDPAAAVDVPDAFLELVPAGPSLSAQAAAQEYGGGPVTVVPGGAAAPSPGG